MSKGHGSELFDIPQCYQELQDGGVQLRVAMDQSVGNRLGDMAELNFSMRHREQFLRLLNHSPLLRRRSLSIRQKEGFECGPAFHRHRLTLGGGHLGSPGRHAIKN